MKKNRIFILFTTILSTLSYAQTKFENGYFINESNEKVSCFIKNLDWKNNPVQFEYKITENADIEQASIGTVKEFGVNGVFKYVRKTVGIDRSSVKIDDLDNNRNPEFSEETLFLKVQVEGEASLYVYEEVGLIRFFYSVDDSEVTQLVYKSYLSDKQIAYNYLFRQQIFRDLKCSEQTTINTEKLRYQKNDLQRVFIIYNECNDTDYIIFKQNHNKDLINLTIRPGLNVSSLSVYNPLLSSRDTDFDQEIAFRLGAELEIILPFHNNKWSAFLEPTYQYYKSEKTISASGVAGGILNVTADYESIELAIGLRHYLFLNQDSKIFLDAAYVFDIISDSKITFDNSSGFTLNTLDGKTSGNLGLGIGYKLKDKYSLSFRYSTKRNILVNYGAWGSRYETITAIFGYRIF